MVGESKRKSVTADLNGSKAVGANLVAEGKKESNLSARSRTGTTNQVLTCEMLKRKEW